LLGRLNSYNERNNSIDFGDNLVEKAGHPLKFKAVALNFTASRVLALAETGTEFNP
jgi:hypothetical protein